MIKDPAQNCFLASCLDCECCKCGVKLLKFSDLEMSLSEDAPDVSWERYEYISIGSKKKLTLVRKCTKPGIMFNYFKELLDKFAGHQFRAQWQNEQLSEKICCRITALLFMTILKIMVAKKSLNYNKHIFSAPRCPFMYP